MPKIHKKNFPLRPIVSSIGSITYQASKLLTTILSPLTGKTSSHVVNSVDFANKISNLVVPPGKKVVSYDVKSLFTIIPVKKAVEVAKKQLELDTTLQQRTSLQVNQIIELLDFVLSTTYFVYNDSFYQQLHGAAMGSPVSPVIANLYMEYFANVALNSVDRPPDIWFRYVDDTCTVLHVYDIDRFTQHINSIDEHIQFTIEPENDNKMPFLDTCIHVNNDASTKISLQKTDPHRSVSQF